MCTLSQKSIDNHCHTRIPLKTVLCKFLPPNYNTFKPFDLPFFINFILTLQLYAFLFIESGGKKTIVHLFSSYFFCCASISASFTSCPVALKKRIMLSRGMTSVLVLIKGWH